MDMVLHISRQEIKKSNFCTGWYQRLKNLFYRHDFTASLEEVPGVQGGVECYLDSNIAQIKQKHWKSSIPKRSPVSGLTETPEWIQVPLVVSVETYFG